MLLPVGESILVSPIKVEEMTSAGIYIPDTARVTPDKGTVVRVGEDVKCPEVLHEGATVLFRKNSGHSVIYKSEEYIILPVKEVLGVIKEEN